MPYYKEIRTGKAVGKFVEQSGVQWEHLAETHNGEPIVAARMGGSKKPPILIKAGSHASELASIHAALTLIEERADSDFEIHIIPCCSPFDFSGYRCALEYAVGQPVNLKDDASCREALQKFGQLEYQGDSFELYSIKDLIFGYVDRANLDPRDLVYGGLHRLALNNSKVREAVTGREMFFPNEIYHQEDFGPYDHGGLTLYANSTGFVANMNNFYDRYDPPLEVQTVREYCERIEPGLCLDLHESCIGTRIHESLRTNGRTGSPEELGSHFLILPHVHAPSYDAVETPVADAMMAAAKAEGFECMNKETLTLSWGYPDTQYFEGYVRWNNFNIMPFYQWAARYPAAITVESRLDLPVETRVKIQTAMIRGAIEEYAHRIADFDPGKAGT